MLRLVAALKWRSLMQVRHLPPEVSGGGRSGLLHHLSTRMSVVPRYGRTDRPRTIASASVAPSSRLSYGGSGPLPPNVGSKVVPVPATLDVAHVLTSSVAAYLEVTAVP